MTSTGSKLRRIQQEQRLATGLDRRAQRVDTRQQTGEIEACGAQLARIEIILRFLAQRGFGHQRPHVGVSGVSERLQIFDRGRADFVRIVFRPVQQPRGQLVEGVDGIVQRLGELAQIGACSGGEMADLVSEQLVERAATANDLAPDQVSA